MEPLILLALVLIGLFAGAITGLTGSSGVSVVVPILALFLGFSMYAAIGASLLVDIMSSLVVSMTYFRSGNTDLRHGLWLALGSVTGAQFGAHFAVRVPEAGLAAVFALSLLATGVILWRKGYALEDVIERYGGRLDLSTRGRVLAATIGFGVLIGFITGILGASGGLGALAVLIVVMGYSFRKAVGTSTFIMIFTAASAIVPYQLYGHMMWYHALILGVAAMVGGNLAARYANRTDLAVLARVIAVAVLILGALMLLTVFL